MDNIKTDNYYIQKIQQDLEFIVKHMKNVDIEELNANEILLDSMLFRMIQISENSRKLTEEYKQKRRMIPWNAMYGMRNRIVHDYLFKKILTIQKSLHKLHALCRIL